MSVTMIYIVRGLNLLEKSFGLKQALRIIKNWNQAL